MESKTGRRRVRHAERKFQALELRSRGLTVRAVGQAIGVSGAQAHRLIVDALGELNTQSREAAEKLRDLECERLDSLLVGVWGAAVSGDTAAINAALRIGERRAKLLGLDAPARSEVSGPDGRSARTFVDMIREIPPDFTKLTDDELNALEGIATKLAPTEAVS